MAKEEAKVALVAGVTGINGSSIAEALIKPSAGGGPEWKVYGLGGRPKPESLPEEIEYIRVNLLDREQTLSRLAHLSDVTHLFWAVWTNRPTERENCEANGSMLQNVVDALLEHADGFRHISLTTGIKYYTGPFELFGKFKPHDPPFREDLPRLPCPNFYYTLQDIVFQTVKRKGGQLTWTEHRPGVVFGYAVGNYMNIVAALCVYAAVCKHEGMPFIFPGNRHAWESLSDASDAELVGAQEVWAVANPVAHNEAFNSMNGDVFTWKQLWPKLAERFGVTVPPFRGEATSLQALMREKGGAWDEMVAKHGLVATKFEDVGQFWFVDVMLSTCGPVLPVASTNKSKEYGFLDFRDSEKSFLYLVDKYKQSKIIP